MTHPMLSHRQRLQAIARQAMRERGFSPDFSAAPVAQAAQLTQPASAHDPTVRDLRQLLWC